MGDVLMTWLACNYVVIMAAFAYEQKWAKASYWLGALIITVSVRVMKA
jgi:hypothetical protein